MLATIRRARTAAAVALLAAPSAWAQQAPGPPGGPAGAASPVGAPTTPASSTTGDQALAPDDQAEAFTAQLSNGAVEIGAVIKQLAGTTPAGVIAETGSDTPGATTPTGDPPSGDEPGDGTEPIALSASTGDAQAVKAPLLWFRDPAGQGGFYVGGDDFWELELIDLASGARERVASTMYDVWGAPTVESQAGAQTITVRWRGLLSPREALGPFDVELEIRLEATGQTTDFQLRAFPQPQVHVRSGQRQWAFLQGATCLPIHQDQADPTVDHFLLTPLGLLVEDPADAVDAFDCLSRPVSQVFGFYNSDGLGLYGSALDPTGARLKNFRFEGGKPDNWIQTKVITHQPTVKLGTVFEALPVRFGLFEGDWWDLALQYRSFVLASEVSSAGLVADRPDVPAWAKNNRALGVFATDVPFELADGQTLDEHLGDWLEHWDVEPDETLVVQFGHSWIDGDIAGIGPYATDPDYLPYLDSFEALGVRLGLYIHDVLFNMESPEYAAGWSEATVRGLGGAPLTQVLDPQGQNLSMALICPSTKAWLDMIRALAGAMAEDHGVDMFYIDNFFPVVEEACFALDHGHPPGLGSYLTEGFAETFRELIDGGNGDGPAVSLGRFTGYSEGHNEAYVPSLGILGPAQVYTDFVSSDSRTRIVPLHAVLYHDLALAGPVRADPYFLLPGEGGCPLPPCDPPAVSVWSTDPIERELARRSAGFVLAWGWANGSALWSPERSFLDPDAPWAHEFAAPLPPGLADGVEATLFAGELGTLRGGAVARRFLNVGRRLRDAELTVRSPLSIVPAPDVEVELAATYDPYNPGQLLGPERELYRPVVQGVWSDPAGKARAIALANFTTDDLVADVTVDPAALALEDDTSYALLRWSGGSALPLGSIAGDDPPAALSLPVAGESAFLLIVEPQ